MLDSEIDAEGRRHHSEGGWLPRWRRVSLRSQHHWVGGYCVDWVSKISATSEGLGLRQGGGECAEGLGDVEGVLVDCVWVQLAQLGRTPTCLSLGGVE